jgi:hypothetical protein
MCDGEHGRRLRAVRSGGDRPSKLCSGASVPSRRGSSRAPHGLRYSRYSERMTVRELLTALQALPRDAELLAFEAGCEDYCEREVDDYLAS